MAIYDIAYHGYKHAPSADEMDKQLAVFNAGFAVAPHVEEFFVGRYAGDPADGYHDAACLKFKNLDA